MISMARLSLPGEWSIALYAGETILVERVFNVILK